MSTTDIKQVVKEKYGQAALRVKTGGSSCCGATAASSLGCDPITSNLYNSSDAGQIPEEAMLASLGCGNPTALAKLNPGEVVLDLGLRRRDRCPALGEAGWAHRQGLRPRYDRRNACAGQREQAQSRG